ncbi:MAG: carbohydrate binding family 9 domain-containing protein, partial [Acidobacteria bacterium]|nr:carbohydrate binding family 9 domain-containing protein [Acidobacteriota bacterium]
MTPQLVLVLSVAYVSIAALAFAQQSTAAIDGPPAPVPPDVIARDGAGHVTIRAIKLASPLRVDGTLDEDVYQQEKSFGGLIQAVPTYGAEQSERSDMWVMYDDTTIYVACRCWDSAPPDEWVVNELRRDTKQLQQNDHFGVSFDTFYDRRSGFIFYTNPLGARGDYSIVDEGSPNLDWNPVWKSKTGRFVGGWTVEMAIPFKSLRYRSGPNRVWGIQLRRSIRRKNEWAYLTRVPQILGGPQAFSRISAGATLVGLDLPPAAKNLELKPYVTSRVTTDELKTPPVRNDVTGDIGGDVKYGLTANLTADFTYNTDFAQVEIDEQQVNLTRFSLFFPEKRDFFLEGRGIFEFGRGGVTAAQSSSVPSTSIQPYLFYSRRIGFNRNRIIPIVAGARLTGKAGKYGIGVMDIETGEDDPSATEPTNFSVVRVKRDILRRSSIGAMFTNRST